MTGRLALHTFRRPSARTALFATTAALIAMGQPLHAQESAAPQAEADTGTDILVTAQRRSETIQQVPIAITAITADAMAKSNVRGIEDYFAMTPNVSFVSNGSRDRKDLSIRGISNQLDPYADVRPAAYAFYIDDFSVVAGTSNPDVVDLERIEVLRGPQGTYFGRNSVGGAINVSTKKPTNEFGGEIRLGYSSFDTKRGSLVLNVPIIKDVLAIRAAGQIETSDGNIRNINAIGGGNNTNYKTGRVIARFTPSSDFTNDLTFSYTRERNGMRAGVPTGYLTTTWRTLYYGGRAGLANPDGVGFFPQNSSEVNYNRPQSVGNTFWYVSDRFNYDLDAVTLTGVVGYLKSKTFNSGDVDGGSIDYFYEDNHLTRDSLSAELRLASNGNHRFEWTVGINGGKDTGNTNQSTRFGSAGLQNRPAGFEISGILSNAQNNYFAAFAQGTYHLTDTIDVTLGGRYSHEYVARQYLRRSNGTTTDNINRSIKFDDFSPRINVTWKPSRDFMLYGTVSKGFKSGGVQTSQLIQQDFYKPENLWNYEIGTKFSGLDGRVRVDLSAFYMDWRNVQEASRFIYLNAQGLLITVNGIDNAANARSYGVDASADFRLFPELTLSLHGGYANAKFKDYRNALVDGVQIDATGKPLINSPKWTAGGSLEYRSTFVGDFDGYIRPEWNYRSETLSSILALRYYSYPFISPAYNTFNLRTGIENKTMGVSFYIENLGNAHYYSNTYEKSFYSGVQVEPSFRRFGVSAFYKF